LQSHAVDVSALSAGARQSAVRRLFDTFFAASGLVVGAARVLHLGAVQLAPQVPRALGAGDRFAGAGRTRRDVAVNPLEPAFCQALGACGVFFDAELALVADRRDALQIANLDARSRIDAVGGELRVAHVHAGFAQALR